MTYCKQSLYPCTCEDNKRGLNARREKVSLFYFFFLLINKNLFMPRTYLPNRYIKSKCQNRILVLFGNAFYPPFLLGVGTKPFYRKIMHACKNCLYMHSTASMSRSMWRITLKQTADMWSKKEIHYPLSINVCRNCSTCLASRVHLCFYCFAVSNVPTCCRHCWYLSW